ncbi:MAG: acyl-CoA dehydrogenase, partial [Dehalococcoidales bacterium]|nr:acyl-CoA dehydrogenase [Dehalococcoidales bacterium]
IAEGKIKVTVAVAELKASYTAEDIRLKAEKHGENYVLNGSKSFVPDAGEADYIIGAARTGENEEDITLFIVPADISGLSTEPMKTVSGEKLDVVYFTDVTVEAGNRLGEAGRGWQTVETVMQRANVALCAGMAGLARKALDLALEYAKERIAFDHPIGAFQSIQHRCADMLIDVDGSRFATYQAAWKLTEGLPAEKEVAIAKAWVSKACKRVMHSAHQVHGAIGFSEEHVLHYYIKLARAYEAGFGGPDYHLARLVRLS